MPKDHLSQNGPATQGGVEHQLRASLRQLEERHERAVAAGKVGLWEWDLATDKVREWKR